MLSPGVNRIVVKDVFGQTTGVSVGDDSVTTIINNASRNEDATKAVLDITGTKQITAITYVDVRGVEHTVNVNSPSCQRVEEINGATEVTIHYYDNTITNLVLTVDTEGPAITDAYKKDGKITLKLTDTAGLSKVLDENKQRLHKFTNFTNCEIIEVGVADYVTRIYAYDTYDNKAILELEDLPTIQNMYKTGDRTISVDTNNIDEIYYYNSYGEKVVLLTDPEGKVEIKVPDNVTTIYFKDGNGNEIEVIIPQDIPTIEKPTLIEDATSDEYDTVSLGIDDAKEVDKLICYNEAGEGTEIDGDDIDENGLVRVPKGTTRVEIVYTDGTRNTVDLQEYTEPELGDVYDTGNGTMSVTVTSSVGIQEVHYKLKQGDVVGEEVYVIPMNGEKEATIELPLEATEIVVIDIMGQDTSVDTPDTQDLPRVTDVQENPDGETEMTSNKPIYYIGEDGNEHEAEMDDTGKITIPEGISEVYTKDPEVVIDISNVSVKVRRAAISGDRTRLALSVEATKTIAQLIYLDADNDELRTDTINEATINQIFQVTQDIQDVAKVRLVYQDGKTTNIDLLECTIPQIISNYIFKQDETKIIIITNGTGVSVVHYVDENGNDQEVIPTRNGSEFEVVIPEGIDNITVMDDVECETNFDVTTNIIVAKATRNETQTSVSISVTADKQITSMVLVDENGRETPVEIEGTPVSITKTIDTVAPTRRIVVTYQGGTKSIINLRQDADNPEVRNLYKTGENGVISVTLKDESGIHKVTDENGRPIELRLVQNQDETQQTAHYIIPEGVDKVYVYDEFGNVTVIDLNNIPITVSEALMNDEGTNIKVIVEDVRGIVKITDTDGNIIESFVNTPNSVVRTYDNMKNIEGIRIYYGGEGDDEYEEIWLKEKEVQLNLTNLVDEDSDGKYEKATFQDKYGIKDVTYKNGNTLRFFDDLPTSVRVDSNEERVAVNDCIGNQTTINNQM